MPFIEQEASLRYRRLTVKEHLLLHLRVRLLTNTVTGREYMSDAEAMADVNDPNTDTKSEHLRRDVKITVEALPLGGDSKL